MAKTNNKYTSINFNHLYEKQPPVKSDPNTPGHPIKTLSSSSSASFSYSTVSSPNKTHGRMLVLTRPTHKPIAIPQPQLQTQQSHPTLLQNQQPNLQNKQIHHPKLAQEVLDPPRVDPGPDAISLRPLGRTGTGSPGFSPALNQDKDKESSVVISPKPNKFVPPHLRPGFAGREERPSPDVIRAREAGQKQFGSPNRYGEGSRPKSGGGYERMRGGGESNMGMMNRPRSSGNRPNSRGW